MKGVERLNGEIEVIWGSSQIELFSVHKQSTSLRANIPAPSCRPENVPQRKQGQRHLGTIHENARNTLGDLSNPVWFRVPFSFAS